MNEFDADRAFARAGYPVFLIAAALIGVHAVRLALEPAADVRVIAELSFVPARYTYAFDQEGVLRAAARAIAGDEISRAELSLLLGGPLRWWTALSYMLLHGGAAHLVMNCVWLLAFGTAVARRFGAMRFLALFMVTGVAGAAVFYAFHPYGLQPVIGASAAISGAMGAAVRFAFAPGAPLGGGYTGERNIWAYRRAAPPLLHVLKERRAMTFLGLWFALNLLFGVVAPIGADGPVAWEAHIGGFLSGFLGFALFDPSPSAAE